MRRVTLLVVVDAGGNSHAEDAKSTKVGSRCTISLLFPGKLQAESEPLARVLRNNNPVVPQTCARIVRVSFFLVLLSYWCFECFFLLLRPLHASHQRMEQVSALITACPTRSFASRLICASTDAACSPPITEILALGHIHRNRGLVVNKEGRAGLLVSPSTHPIIACPKTSPDDDCHLRHPSTCHSHHHLGSILCDTARLGGLSNHEAGDVLEEDDWDVALLAQLDKVCAFERRFRKEDAVVGNDPDRISFDLRKAYAVIDE